MKVEDDMAGMRGGGNLFILGNSRDPKNEVKVATQPLNSTQIRTKRRSNIHPVRRILARSEPPIRNEVTKGSHDAGESEEGRKMGAYLLETRHIKDLISAVIWISGLQGTEGKGSSFGGAEKRGDIAKVAG